MPFEHDIRTDCASDNLNKNDTWQRLGDVARRLVEAEFLPISESLIDYDDDFGGVE